MDWKGLVAPLMLGLSVGLFSIMQESTGLRRFGIALAAALLGVFGLRRALRDAYEKGKKTG
jgi:hypothetical protein